ncbi:hypothetical protein PSTH2693_17270 [Pseudomonas syringae pv. theae]|nr:hypothetical protein PSTH2693_17270 [Pseudomonas syringae pv. theae]
MELRDVNPVTRWGTAGVLGTILLTFSGHWHGNVMANERVELADYKSQVLLQDKEKQPIQKRTYSLDIRGVGVGIHQDYQSTIWEFIKKKNNNFSSIYSQNPNDYKASLSSRESSGGIKIRAAFQHSAGEAVAYWPVPVFALGPPNPYKKPYRAANLINSGRNKATLGVTQLLWQDDESTTHAQAMIERMFQFFENNPKVPQALIASQDGDITRDIYRKSGTPGLPKNAQVVPTVFESMTGLLVTRSDRVDRDIRPYATNEPEDNQNKDTDLGKLWAFYWDRDKAFMDWYRTTEKAKGVETPYAPGTMSTAYWQPNSPPSGKPSATVALATSSPPLGCRSAGVSIRSRSSTLLQCSATCIARSRRPCRMKTASA